MAVQNSLAKRQTKTGLTAYLTQDAVKKQINSVVGGKNGTRFVSSIVSAVQTTPALQECTNPSILSAALLGEALNLSPSPQLGQFYINSDLDTIEGFRSKYELQIKDVYLRTLDLSTAMQEKARLEEVEQRLEQRRQEEERKARETIKTGAPEKEPVREKEEPEERISKAEQQVAAEEVPVFQMDFRVWGTKEQLMKLRQYLMDNHMKFGKVE